MRTMIVTTCFLLGTLAMIYGGSRSSGSSTPNSSTVAVVTSDDRCATEVPGAGPCCCFYNTVSEQHCWYPTQDYHVGNWRLTHIGGNDSCGPECMVPMCSDPVRRWTEKYALRQSPSASPRRSLYVRVGVAAVSRVGQIFWLITVQ